jgi:hypothetical protein
MRTPNNSKISPRAKFGKCTTAQAFCLIFSWFFLFAAKSEAAFPTTHLYFAEKWVAQKAPVLLSKGHDFDHDEFILGNFFPDIRYMGGMTREETHEKNVTVEAIENSPSWFVAGMRLHAFVDDVREDCVQKWKIYPLIEPFSMGYRETFLKLIEDEILYDRVNISFALACLMPISEGEKATGISTKSIHKWHQRLCYYLGARPQHVLNALVWFKKGIFQIPPEVVKEWQRSLPVLAQLPELRDYVERLSSEFDKLFEND